HTKPTKYLVRRYLRSAWVNTKSSQKQAQVNTV
ncbi:tryptophan synthase beta chain 1 domain protein, partial [Vibrio parahaemolyticus VP2007-007]